MLEVRGLEAAYGASQVLFGVDFAVRAGEVVTLLGRNGAGKTTTLKSIMGMVPRREGAIRFEGAEIIRMPSHRIGRRGTARCPQQRGNVASTTIAQNKSVATN